MKQSFNVNGMSKTTHWPQYIAGASAAGGALAVGTALGWPAPTERRLLDDLEQGFEITDVQWDWIGSIITVGCAISCLPIGFLMKKFGRKWTMLSLVIPFIVGWALLIWAVNAAMMIAGRFLIGIAGGAFCISAPQYSAEIAEKEIRGIIGTFFQILINTGILFVYCIGPFLTVFWTNIICALVAVLFGIIFFFMPESPVYLVIEDRIDDARKTYKWLRGDHYDPQDEIDAIRDEIEETLRNEIPFGDLMRQRASKLAVFIGFGLALFQQMSGINVVIFYSTRIFNAADVDMNPDISTIIMGSVNLGFTCVGAVLVDRLGRRLLLLVSIIGMTICTAALGVFFFLQDLDEALVETLGWLPLTSLSIFLIAFAIGYGPVVWLMIGEVYSKELSTFVSPLTGFSNWMFAFIITLSFRPIEEAITLGPTFWIFSGVSFVGILFTFFIIPETKGKSMSDIQKMLAGDKNVDD